MDNPHVLPGLLNSVLAYDVQEYWVIPTRTSSVPHSHRASSFDDVAGRLKSERKSVRSSDHNGKYIWKSPEVQNK